MQVIIQRVSSAMLVSGITTKEIGTGLVALVGVEKGDTDANIKRMAERSLGRY